MRARRKVIVRFARHGDKPRFLAVFVLAVAASSAVKIPAILLKLLDDFANLQNLKAKSGGRRAERSRKGLRDYGLRDYGLRTRGGGRQRQGHGTTGLRGYGRDALSRSSFRCSLGLRAAWITRDTTTQSP